MTNILERFFKLSQHDTTVKKEFIGGLTTFLTMAYIIFVNPDILSLTGMEKGALITVTIVASIIGTLLSGLYANLPFAMAPGMGLNAMFTFSICLGEKIPWQIALGVVFISGIFFLILTATGIRTKILNAIPSPLRLAVGAGIGIFIAFIGLQNMGLVVDNGATLVGIGDLSIGKTFFGLLGILIIAVLEVKKIKGSILWGILIITGLSLFSSTLGITESLISMPDGFSSLPPSMSPLIGEIDILGALKISSLGIIFSFMFVDLFDSIGTIMACSEKAGYVDKNGNILRVNKILLSDAIATMFGAFLGTSTTTTYVESSAGVAAGARTGLASVFTALFFVLALFLSPLISIVPSYATAPALIIVGVHMFMIVRKIDLSDFTKAIPVFLTIILMPLTYSISTGLSFGFISWTILQAVSGKHKEISLMMWIITILSAVNLLNS